MVTRITASEAPKVGSLEALAAQADSMGPGLDGDGAPGAAPGAPVAVQATSAERNTKALCAIVALFREFTASGMFKPPLVSIKHHLPDDKLPALVGPWVVVLEHYGIDALGGMDHPVAVALITTGPPLWALVADLREELKARAAKTITTPPADGSPA